MHPKALTSVVSTQNFCSDFSLRYASSTQQPTMQRMQFALIQQPCVKDETESTTPTELGVPDAGFQYEEHTNLIHVWYLPDPGLLAGCQELTNKMWQQV